MLLSLPSADTVALELSLNAKSSSWPGVSIRTYSAEYWLKRSVTLFMLTAMRSAATICAPFGPREYSPITSSSETHSRISMSGT